MKCRLAVVFSQFPTIETNSNGLMSDDVTLSGEELGPIHAECRARWEPIYEITQVKCDGETHPMLSPRDEIADYGTWDKGSFGPEPKTTEVLPREHAREAWIRGMVYENALGTNPFKFGVVGSTDSHTGLSTAQEKNSLEKSLSLNPQPTQCAFKSGSRAASHQTI